MENENESAQLDVVEQEEETSVDAPVADDTSEDTVTIPKSEFNRIKRKAIAYDSKKDKPEVEVKTEVKTETKEDSSFSEEAIDRKILKSQGLDEDSINYLSKIAKINGVSLIDAKGDELFKAFVAKKEAEKKSREASLGASRGSTKKEPEKKTGLTRDEHRAKWEKQTGLNA
jgi:hypothetical protein